MCANNLKLLQATGPVELGASVARMGQGAKMGQGAMPHAISNGMPNLNLLPQIRVFSSDPLPLPIFGHSTTPG